MNKGRKPNNIIENDVLNEDSIVSDSVAESGDSVTQDALSGAEDTTGVYDADGMIEISNPVKHTSPKEPLIHITKRRDDTPWWLSFLVHLGAIVAALLIGSIFILALTGLNPIKIYSLMFEGSFKNTGVINGTFKVSTSTWKLIHNSAILLGISLAVTPAFKMKFWNIGAEGQVTIGCLASVACMYYIGDSLPSWLLVVVMMIASILAGMIWAVIPGFFKAKWNTNETLFTLMMNYVAIQLVSVCIELWASNGSHVLTPRNPVTHSGWMPKVLGTQYFINIVIILVLTVLMFIYLKYSKQGYEISVVGGSENTARYIGINVKKVILRTVAISGALCGVIGWLLVSGSHHTVSTNIADGNGFTAIMVSWMSKFNPFLMIVNSFLICFLKIGSSALASDPSLHLDKSLGDIITGLVILFIIGSEFFLQYKINFRKSHPVEVQ